MQKKTTKMTFKNKKGKLEEKGNEDQCQCDQITETEQKIQVQVEWNLSFTNIEYW